MYSTPNISATAILTPILYNKWKSIFVCLNNGRIGNGNFSSTRYAHLSEEKQNKNCRYYETKAIKKNLDHELNMRAKKFYIVIFAKQLIS